MPPAVQPAHRLGLVVVHRGKSVLALQEGGMYRRESLPRFGDDVARVVDDAPAPGGVPRRVERADFHGPLAPGTRVHGSTAVAACCSARRNEPDARGRDARCVNTRDPMGGTLRVSTCELRGYWALVQGPPLHAATEGAVTSAALGRRRRLGGRRRLAMSAPIAPSAASRGRGTTMRTDLHTHIVPPRWEDWAARY